MLDYNQLPVSIGLDLSRPEHRAALLVFIDTLDALAANVDLSNDPEYFDGPKDFSHDIIVVE